jgi:hypothetical protein
MALWLERKEDLSVFYHISDLFATVTFAIIEDSFPETVVQLPTIAIDAGTLDHEIYEMGNKTPLRIRKWYIDVFAKNKSQRDDFCYKILNSLDSGINVYNYDEGFPPSVSPSKIGHLGLLKKSFLPIPVIVEENSLKYYRGQVIVLTQNDQV